MKKNNKSYAVLGLGSYGMSVARALVKDGADVLAVDSNEALVNSAIAEIPCCRCADVTDPEVIKQLGISDFDTVIISMASSFESAVMATMLCKEAGVKTIITKCARELHRNILYKTGADKVVFPEQESGERLAKNLLSSNFIDIMELSHGFSIIELDVLPDWVGKTLMELHLRRRFEMNVIAFRFPDRLEVNVDPNLPLTDDMALIVIASTENIKKIK